jgi:hypothetical protein
MAAAIYNYRINIQYWYRKDRCQLVANLITGSTVFGVVAR